MYKCFQVAVLLVTLLMASVGGKAQEFAALQPVRASGMPEGFYLEVDPRVELLVGVLGQTSWIEMMKPKGPGSDYYLALHDFFRPYANHQAVRIAEELLRSGFSYDALPNFMLSSGALPELTAPIGGYSSYLIGRAGSAEKLESFRKALADLAVQSDFKQFLTTHRNDYQNILAETMRNIHIDKEISWLRSFFGSSGDEFHVVLAPGMYIHGYGSRIALPDGKWVTNVVLSEGVNGSGWLPFPSENILDSWSTNIWVRHSFITPSVEKKWDLAAHIKLVELFLSVDSLLEKQSIRSTTEYFHQQIYWAITALAAQDLYGEEAFRKQVYLGSQKGFMLTPLLLQELKRYRANRDTYPTLDSFISELFYRLYAEKAGILALTKQVLTLQDAEKHDQAEKALSEWLMPTKPSVCAIYNRTMKQGDFQFDVTVLPVAGHDEVTSIMVAVDGKQVQLIMQPAKQNHLTVNTVGLADGVHELSVVAVGKNQSVSQYFDTFTVQNWYEQKDYIDKPIAAPLLGKVDFSKVHNASKGWKFIDSPKSLFNDSGRLTPTQSTPEYLVWKTPNLGYFAVTLSVTDAELVRLPELVAISASTALDAGSWYTLTYSVEQTNKIDGWTKVVLSGNTPELSHWLRITLQGVHPDAVQLGEVKLVQRRW